MPILTLDELRHLVAAGTIDTVVAAQVDMQGRLMGKRFTAPFFLASAHAESHSCNYLQATDLEMYTVEGYRSASWEKGYGDYIMKPDLSTLRLTPWLDGTALVLADVLDHHHRPVAHSPRAMLQAQIARLAEHGLAPITATELEYFLFKESFEEAEAKGLAGLTPISAYNEDYNIFQTTKEESVMRAIRNGLLAADVPIENTKGEADAGQGEINVRYADALTMADRHVIIKNAAKEIAWAKGRAITFMAKWHNRYAGNSAHIHHSLADSAGAPAFYDPAAPHGMSGTMRHYLAGVLAHMREITYFLAPYVNSYKRFSPGTFAPTKIVWSLDNRTAGVRVVGEETKGVRLECRVGGADLNPYLAFAALIAAGLDGLERGLELASPFSGDAYQASGTLAEVPATLREATESLEGSAMLRAAFGDAVVDHYVHAARWEQAEADRTVTDFDLRRGFERV
ncbi:glutamine synthetase family protein [Acuticoccus mangrovi]|uniref:Glutamine synthetase n=1 Tax=Acuticoccus mangrovi TaxID=2796142 RepID=A0A934ILC9_9HYPH|nr:glutamine synthetase family protein [Acuticoccus mangrovi]MBJ3778638.1 glutamine synthetase [Acuticoccus mangrovi]